MLSEVVVSLPRLTLDEGGLAINGGFKEQPFLGLVGGAAMSVGKKEAFFLLFLCLYIVPSKLDWGTTKPIPIWEIRVLIYLLSLITD